MKKPLATELVFFWVLFGIAGVVAFFILSPYLTALFLSLVLAIMFAPVHTWLLKRNPKRHNAVALASTLLVALLILVPIAFFAVILFGEVLDVYASLVHKTGGVTAIDIYTQQAQTFIAHYVPGFQLQIDGQQYLSQALGWIAQNLNKFFSGILDATLGFFIILVGLFFFFHDGESLREGLIRWSPLSDKRDESILRRVTDAVSSVVKGSIFLAMIQGLLTGIGFAIFGVPNPVLWGSIGVIAALVPPLGTTIVNVPAAVYLIFTGSTTMGVGLLLWSIFVVASIDNILRPKLISRGVNMHAFIILLSVLGGLALFGPIGFIAGPVVMAFFFSLVEIYPSITSGSAIDDTSST